jgi:hypothetical protein
MPSNRAQSDAGGVRAELLQQTLRTLVKLDSARLERPPIRPAFQRTRLPGAMIGGAAFSFSIANPAAAL